MILVNALRGIEARVRLPKTGAWFADVDVDLELPPVVPSGASVLTVGTTFLRGTVDERASGRFGSKAKVRLVGGGGGWDKPVPSLHIHNDAGVFSTAVYAVTGASVGEVVVELGAPVLMGVDYARMRGPASQVFAGVDWHVDILGITNVGPRLPLPAPPTAEILNWDPTTKVAEVASDILILPGMTLVDPLRFGVATVDEVEHTFSASGSRALAWCSTPSVGVVAAATLAAPPASAGSKLLQAVAAVARHSAGVATLKHYPYRLVSQGPDGRMVLQSTKPLGDAPPFLQLIDVWAGIPGLKVKLTPSSVVLVGFIEGDRARPVVVGFDPDAPPAIEINLNALRVSVGEVGAHPAALGDAVIAAFNAVAANAGATSGAMTTALASLLPLIPSTKLFAD